MAQVEKRKIQLLHRIRTTRNAVLHYDYAIKDLAVWYWPSNDIGERVAPSDFEAYRLSYDIQGPCCLCPLLHEDVGAFAESAIKMIVRGRHAGEYGAMCAGGRCGYFVLVEQVYHQRGLPICRYPLRDVNNPAPLSVTTGTHQQGKAVRFRFKRRRTEGRDIDLGAIDTCAAPMLGPRETFNLLLKLDAAANPGITGIEFKNLFVKCGGCGMFSTRRAFQSHECVVLQEEGEVIDLTVDEA